MGAAVLRDSLGLVIGAKIVQTAVEGVLEGEVFAAPIGIEEAECRGFRELIIEGDSLLAIEGFQKFPSRVNWRVHERISESASSLSAFVSCGFNFVNRVANMEVHHLLDGLPLRLVLEATTMFMSTIQT